jgi:hypothetical protein
MFPRTDIRQKWSRLLVLVLLVWPALAAIAYPATSSAQDDQQPLDLSGVFTVTIDEIDIPRDLADGPTLNGVWSIDFGGDGVLSLSRLDAGQVASGHFSAGDTTVTFDDWNGLVGCVIANEHGEPPTYGWRRTESALILTPIRDSCRERLTLLATRPLGSDEACVAPAERAIDSPIIAAGDPEVPGTPGAVAPPVSGVAAQEGLSDSAKAEAAVDGLLGQANGCWATGDAQSFLALHSDDIVQELVFMAPPDVIVSGLRRLMMAPATFDRIGDVTLGDPDHAWTYVELTYDEEPLPLRVDFVNQDGDWLFDTYMPLVLSQPIEDGSA